VIFEFPEMTLLNLLFAIISGIIFGVVAKRFSVIFNFIQSNTNKIIKNPILRPLFGGFIIAAFFLISGNTRYLGLGIPVIEESFQHQLPIYEFAIKLLLTAFTLAVGFKGGEVTPLFFIGACLGNALALFLPLPVSLLAGMGFVAVFGAAANTPIACIFMGIELFGAQSGLYIAISCIMAYLVSGNDGIYKNQKMGVPKF
jgi:H+/Cl- antiporter ClcA